MKKYSLNPGDLAKHKSTGAIYLIVKNSGAAKNLVGVVLKNGTLGFMHENWLELINESR